MIFDESIKLVEKWGAPNLKTMMQECAVLDARDLFNGKELKPTTEGFMDIYHNGLLPYNPTFFEMVNFGVLIKKDETIGFEKEIHMEVFVGNEFHVTAKACLLQLEGEKISADIEILGVDSGFLSMLNSVNDEHKKQVKQEILDILISTMNVIQLMNQKSMVLISEEPIKKHNGISIARSQYRKIYKVISMREAVNRFTGAKHDEESFRKVSPHFRRRHYRTLVHERFKEKKRILIESMWIGNKELSDDKKIYKVVL